MPVTFVGVATVIVHAGMEWSLKALLGDILILFAVVAWALYTVLGKRLVSKYGAIHLTALSIIIGTILFALSILWIVLWGGLAVVGGIFNQGSSF